MPISERLIGSQKKTWIPAIAGMTILKSYPYVVFRKDKLIPPALFRLLNIFFHQKTWLTGVNNWNYVIQNLFGYTSSHFIPLSD